MAAPGFGGLDLSGKVALVTGASSGIGCAVAKLLAARGAAVAVNYQRSRTEAERVVDDIRQTGGQAVAIQADVSTETDVQRLVATVKTTLGAVDILVNNAGRKTSAGRFPDIGIDVWDEHYRCNVRSAVLLCQAALPDMVAHGWGRVVNVSSRAARLGGANNAIYYAAGKAALDALTTGLGVEYANTGVLVNAVAPGLIDTPIHADSQEWFARASAAVPIGRAGSAAEVAEVVAFLASPANSYMVGEIVGVGGGR